MLQTGSMRLTIRNNWDLSLIEVKIEEYLPNCTIWGDLNITATEYENLQSKIKAKLGERPTFSDFRKVMKKFPYSIITDIISYVLFEYDNQNFWDSWASSYDLELTAMQQGELGRMILSVFEKFHFDIIRDEGYTYVSTILYQAGIPAISFNRLFEAVESTLSSVTLTSRDLVNELLGYRSTFINVAVRRNFERNREGAVELIDNLRNLLRLAREGSESGELAEIAGVPERIVEQYKKWHQEYVTSGRSYKRNNQFYISPKLCFDEIKGVCLFLPEQTLKDDSIYKLRWEISCKNPDEEKTVFSDVYSNNRHNTTLSCNISVNPAESYKITLFDDDKIESPLTEPWEIEGISAVYPLLSFHENGLMHTRQQALISRNGTIIVYPSDPANRISKFHLNSEDLYLSRSWQAAYTAIRVYPTDSEAYFSINTDIVLRARKTFEFELAQYGVLFNETYFPGEIPVYRKFPDINVYGSDEKILNSDSIHKEFASWQVVLTNRSLAERHTVLFSDLPIGNNGDHLEISISNTLEQKLTEKYGIYDLRIYDGKSQKKQFTFYYVPTIHISSDPVTTPDRVKSSDQTVIFMEKKDLEKVEFNSEEVSISDSSSSSKNSNWTELKIRNNSAYIRGYILLRDAYKVPFKKTIKQLEWEFWNETENIILEANNKTFYPKDFTDNTWRLKIHTPNSSEFVQPIYLELRSADNKILQVKECWCDKKGNSYITLNMFQETIGSNSLPQKLILKIEQMNGDSKEFNLASVKSFVQLRSPTFKEKLNMIVWDRNNENQLTGKELELNSLNDPTMMPIRVSLKDIKNLSSPDGSKKYQGVKLDIQLKDGAYFLDAVDSGNLSFFEEDEDEIRTITYEKNHILVVNVSHYLQKHFELNPQDAKNWLEAIIVAQTKLDLLSDLFNKFKDLVDARHISFSADTSAQILFPIVLSAQKKSEMPAELKKKVREIYSYLGNHVITNVQRTELLKKLLESELSDQDIKYVINELQLYLFAPTEKIYFDRSLLYKAWNINEELAILINLRDCAHNISADIDRVIDRIGEDSLKEMIRFDGGSTCKSDSWSECFECILSTQGKCSNARFINSEKVWGDESEYAKLFRFDRKNNFYLKPPEKDDTNGFEILGKTYLKLIFENIQQYQNGELEDNAAEARNVFKNIDNLMHPISEEYKEFESTLSKRRGSSQVNDYFLEVGRASLLQALRSRGKTINLKGLLPFWRYAMESCPKLVYRDMIVSELYTIVNEKGKKQIWQ